MCDDMIYKTNGLDVHVSLMLPRVTNPIMLGLLGSTCWGIVVVGNVLGLFAFPVFDAEIWNDDNRVEHASV